jgi:hypothetical protein
MIASPRTLLIAATLASLLMGGSYAQPTATVAVGCMTSPLTTGETTSVGVPLLDLPVVTATVTAVTPNTVSVSDVEWTPNEFIAGGAPHFAAIRTGPQAGRTLLVVGNTADTLTLDVGDTGLDAAGFAVSANTDSVELFQGDTLGSLFGSTADAGGFLSSGLMGGATRNSADNVRIFNGSDFVTYFFDTDAGNWVVAGGGSASQNSLILYPDDGMLVVRRGPAGDLTFLGRVPSTRLLTKFPGGTTNVVAVRFPNTTTLGGLNFGAPGTWIAGSNASSADTVGLWNGTKWEVYFKNLSNLWIKANGNGSDQSGVVIAAGTAIRIVKRGTATGPEAFFGQALPFEP